MKKKRKPKTSQDKRAAGELVGAINSPVSEEMAEYTKRILDLHSMSDRLRGHNAGMIVMDFPDVKVEKMKLEWHGAVAVRFTPEIAIKGK